jgi:hypothetical protein
MFHRRIALLLAALGVGGSAGAAEVPRAPIVLELFSSEGCSSCPAADEVLAQLDAAGEVGGTPVLALELHVDYWDYLGWRDPFSSAELTARQERYAHWLGRRSYTPQLVIDGQTEVLGSNRGRALAAIRAAAQRPSPTAVQLRRQGAQLAVEITGLTQAAGATVLLAITERGLISAVRRGENAGQTLHHGPVVRALRPLGVVQGDRYTVQVPLQLVAEWKPETLRAVVLVQSADGRILGAAALPLGKS